MNLNNNNHVDITYHICWLVVIPPVSFTLIRKISIVPGEQGPVPQSDLKCYDRLK